MFQVFETQRKKKALKLSLKIMFLQVFFQAFSTLDTEIVCKFFVPPLS